MSRRGCPAGRRRSWWVSSPWASSCRVWGSTDEPGVVHDERAIVLQARIFAGGQWRGPTPPEPAAFEQMHVFGEPGVASKYPPFHSAVLVPGVWLSLTGPDAGGLVRSGGGPVLRPCAKRARRVGGPRQHVPPHDLAAKPVLEIHLLLGNDDVGVVAGRRVVCPRVAKPRAMVAAGARFPLFCAHGPDASAEAAYCSCFRWPH